MDVDEPEDGLGEGVPIGANSSSQDDGTNATSTTVSDNVEVGRMNSDGSTTAVPEPSLPVSTDLVDYIPGMYRILDLVSEQGSGGLGKCTIKLLTPYS